MVAVSGQQLEYPPIAFAQLGRPELRGRRRGARVCLDRAHRAPTGSERDAFGTPW